MKEDDVWEFLKTNWSFEIVFEPIPYPGPHGEESPPRIKRAVHSPRPAGSAEEEPLVKVYYPDGDPAAMIEPDLVLQDLVMERDRMEQSGHEQDSVVIRALNAAIAERGGKIDVEI